MLYFKIDGAAVEWTGELIADIRYPRNIELLWSDEELAALGLFKPLPADPVPDGKTVVGETVQIVDDAVKVVLTLEDATAPEVPSTDPADYPLTMRQLRLGLLYNGFGATYIEDAITAMVPEDTSGLIPEQIAALVHAQGLARIWYEETIVVHWGHEMTQALILQAGITQEQAAAMWLVAKDYAA